MNSYVHNLIHSFINWQNPTWLKQNGAMKDLFQLTMNTRLMELYLLHSHFNYYLFLGLGEFSNKELLDSIFNDPTIINAAAAIARLTDDKSSHKVLKYFFFFNFIFIVYFDIINSPV